MPLSIAVRACAAAVFGRARRVPCGRFAAFPALAASAALAAFGIPPLGVFLLGGLCGGGLFSAELGAQTPLQAELVAQGLDRPVGVATPPGDRERMFVIEQWTGRVRIVRRGVAEQRPFLDLGGKVSTNGGERGLLGIAFHPRYATTGYVYLNYTRAADGATLVERYQVSATDADVADPQSATTVVGPISQPFANHNAGCLQFGLDGYLYVATGDGGGGNDVACNGQSLGTLLGKLLRIDVDSASPYAIPPDNPFVSVAGARPEIWSYGLRNPWRFTFDRATGDLWIGDVGLHTREEIDFQPGNSKGGENYGWKVMEGTACNSSQGCPPSVPPCNAPAFVAPLLDYRRPSGGQCVIGGYVYRGCAIPDLRGTYVFADLSHREVWSFRRQGNLVADLRNRTAEFASGPHAVPNITTFGEDSDGELYFTDYFGGRLFKIVPSAPAPALDLGHGKRGSGGQVPEFRACGLLTRGNSARFELRYAPPSTAAVLVVGRNANPKPLLGGILVPWPPAGLALATTSRQGELSFELPGGIGPLNVVAQYVIVDTGNTFRTSMSNALLVAFQP